MIKKEREGERRRESARKGEKQRWREKDNNNINSHHYWPR
jgi:hypothetical protein